MPCCRRDKWKEIGAQQKWNYINLADFRSTSCFTTLSYGILYISFIISISVYAVDTFTAINLLAFNRWGSNVKPTIPFIVSKWIFAGCIIASFVIVGFEWVRAIRVIKRDGVAESYLDPLAVRIQSIRPGKTGQGYRRFLVFAQLTKSKKGADYVALFSYFAFKTWLRVLLAEGPRVVVNAITLWAVLQAQLLPKGKHGPSNGRTAFQQFWFNLGQLADEDRKKAIILGGMVWTMIIWVITALNLIAATLMYLLFLWHWIPSSDGSLSAYCKRKIDGRVSSIVNKTMEKAREKDETKRQLAEAKALKKGERPRQFKREPTLPIVFGDEEKGFDGSPLTRQTTVSTLPPYTSRPGTSASNRAPSASQQPSLPVLSATMNLDRNGTQSTHTSKASNGSKVSLLGHAAPVGQSASVRQLSDSGSPDDPYGPPSSNASTTSFARMHEGPRRLPAYGPGSRPPQANGRRTPGIAPSIRSHRAESPGPALSDAGRVTPFNGSDYGIQNLFDGSSRGPGMSNTPNGRSSPGPHHPGVPFPFPSEPRPSTSHSHHQPPLPPPPTQYTPFNPSRQPKGPLPRPPQRNLTDPGLNGFGLGPVPRSGTAPPYLARPQVTYDDDIYDSYARNSGYEVEMQPQPPRPQDSNHGQPPPRSNTTSPPGAPPWGGYGLI